MLGALHGFTVILVIIGAGYVAARAGIVRGDQRHVLNNLAFYIATPALLFDVLHDSDPSIMLSPVIIVTSIAAVIVATIFIIASRIWFKKPLADTTLGAASSGYVNSNNLGLPVAVYILGDAVYVAPLVLVQLIVFAPIIIAILESTRGNQKGAMVALGRAVTNPIIIASLAGFVVALLDAPVPTIVLDPVSLLGGAAVPMMLMSFGVSLRGQRALEPGSGRAAVFTATGLKVLAMPLFAWLMSLVFGLNAHETFVAVTIAALPTAQNMYNYAATYRKGEIMVRDTVFLSTFVSLPIISVIAWLLAA